VADVRQQLDEQKDAGWLDANEATCVPVDDVAWLAAGPVGTLLREHADSLRREMPFVYALPVGIDEEHTIVRGVIDCVIEISDGLVLLDYKTDQVRDKATFEERCRMYTRQLQLYATAAAAILKQPVKQASLVFIRMRRVLNVSTDLPAPAELFR
jgi:ATP-dependent helicase/nuclease subunit A